MPEVLELKPLKNKSLKLILVESEFPIDWWFEVPKNLKEDPFWNLRLVSKEYIQLIDYLIEKYQPNIALEERPNFIEEGNNFDDLLKSLFQMRKIPFKFADISLNAELYLSSALEEHRSTIRNLEKKINELVSTKGSNSEKEEFFHRIFLWKEYLQQDYDDQENEIRYKVREAWMMMKILNFAKQLEIKRIKAIFICDIRHFEGLEKLSEELGIELEQVKIKRKIKTEEVEKVFEKDLEISFS